MKKVAIVQSNYIPWKGYFDMIAAVDEFILYDDMQYTRRDWRNRNQIKTPQGVQWLTVPVRVKGRYDQKINETEIDSDTPWAGNHWKALTQNYRRAPHFEEIAAWLAPFYEEKSFVLLSDFNRSLISEICKYLGIKTRITSSSDYVLADGKTERLADLCAQAGGATYISGPAAKDYVDESIFQNAGIELQWFEYAGYPEYLQQWGEFTHGVTILDLLFNCGKSSAQYMKYVAS
ncbi:WbqC family protein [Paraburkholderia sp. BR14320]|uniref:WbqC family protein n=1 Tax=unclassified Paraburkholderia TaxID=2615204 RepID=UPI0034CD766C